MALSATSLSSDIKTAIQGKFGTPKDATELQGLCDALASAIVSNITKNAIVTLDPTASVTSGSGSGGTVAGTGKVS